MDGNGETMAINGFGAGGLRCRFYPQGNLA
jgi:hypothetical protein